MRLAAVPVCYHDDVDAAMAAARRQSLATHQGEEAAECCRLMAYVMVRAIHGDGTTAHALDTRGFQSRSAAVTCLAQSRAEPGGDPDRNWYWRFFQGRSGLS